MQRGNEEIIRTEGLGCPKVQEWVSMCQINGHDHRCGNETRFQILLFRERSRVKAVGLKGGWEGKEARCM